jgi:hypothetical protein
MEAKILYTSPLLTDTYSIIVNLFIWVPFCNLCVIDPIHILRSLAKKSRIRGVRSTMVSMLVLYSAEGLGSNLGTSSIFSERPLERFSNRKVRHLPMETFLQRIFEIGQYQLMVINNDNTSNGRNKIYQLNNLSDLWS